MTYQKWDARGCFEHYSLGCPVEIGTLDKTWSKPLCDESEEDFESLYATAEAEKEEDKANHGQVDLIVGLVSFWIRAFMYLV